MRVTESLMNRPKISVFVKFCRSQGGEGEIFAFHTTGPEYEETSKVTLKSDNAFLQKSSLPTDRQTDNKQHTIGVLTVTNDTNYI